MSNLKIKMKEASKPATFSYGEEVGIQSFFSNTDIRGRSYESTLVKFGKGADNVKVYPDGTGAGVRVEITCVTDKYKFATPDTQFSVVYGDGRNDADKIVTALFNILDILDYRKSIIETLTDMGVVA